MRDQEGAEHELPYDRLILSLGSVSRVLPIPGLDEHAVGFKSLADAIWLRNHVIQCLELADATDDAGLRDELLTFVFVGGGYAGLEALAELQDFAAEAMQFYPRARLHGMRWVLAEATDRVLPEIDAELAEYAALELRGRGIDIRLGTTLEEVAADWARISTGETLPTRTVVWTAGVVPHPSSKNFGLPLDDRGRIVVDDHLRVRGQRRGLGARRRRRRPGPGAARPDLPADLAARDPPGEDRGPQRRRHARRRPPGAVRLPQQGTVREPRPLQGGGEGRPAHLPRLSRLVAGAHVPHEPDPGHDAQGPGGGGLDRRPAVQARHRRGRLDRPSAAAARGRVRDVGDAPRLDALRATG